VRYLVCYDVSDDRRRSQLATALLDFGRRVQESVFTAELDEGLHARMVERVRGIVGGEDRLLVVALCAACELRAEATGMGDGLMERKYFVV